MKRLSTYSAGKGLLGLGRVSALAACLLAVSIIHVMAANGMYMFGVHSSHYIDCLDEVIAARSNANDESRIFFWDMVPKIFVSTYIESLEENVKVSEDQQDLQSLRNTYDILEKYLELFKIKIINALEGTDFSEVVALKWRQLKPNYRGNDHAVLLYDLDSMIEESFDILRAERKGNWPEFLQGFLQLLKWLPMFEKDEVDVSESSKNLLESSHSPHEKGEVEVSESSKNLLETSHSSQTFQKLSNLYKTFADIVAETNGEESIDNFIKSLQEKCNNHRKLGKEPSEKKLPDLVQILTKYLQRLEEKTKQDLVSEEFSEAIRVLPTGAGTSESVSENLAEFLDLHSELYYECVDEAIKARPNMNTEIHTLLRAKVLETFSKKNMLFTFIKELRQTIEDAEGELDDQTSLGVNDLYLEFLNLLASQIIGDDEGADVVEGWKKLQAKDRFEIRMDLKVIPGCSLTNERSQSAFEGIVSDSYTDEVSMGDFIGNLRKNSEKMIEDKSITDETTLSDVARALKIYERYIVRRAKTDVLIEAFDRAYDEHDFTKSPVLAVERSGRGARQIQ